MTQYSKRIAIVHWLTVLLLIAAYALGMTLDETHDAAAKLPLFPPHMLLGDAILVLTAVRLYFRMKDGKPAPLAAPNLMDKIATGTHHLIYLLLIAMPLSGIATAATSGLVEALSTHDASKVPDFEKVELLEVHEAIGELLLVVLVLHVAAALYHQFIVKDGLMERISLRRKD